MRMQLIDCENTILREIATPESAERDIAQTYRLAMDSSEGTTMDWGKVNRAIVARWSRTALLRIKRAALSGACFKDAEVSH